MGLGTPKDLQNVVEDLTPQLGGDLDSNSFDVMMGSTDEIQLGDTPGGDAQIAWAGTNLEINTISGNVEFNLPGAWAARTSHVLIAGNAGALRDEPLLKLAVPLSRSNAYMLTVYVGAALVFSLDNEGDLVCGSSITAGGLLFAGATNPVYVHSAVSNGFAIGSSHPNALRHRFKAGVGALSDIYGGHTTDANFNQADVTFQRISDLTNTYTEDGTVVRIVRELSNIAGGAVGEDGDFIQFGDNSANTYLAVDSGGTIQMYGPFAGLTYGGIYVKDSVATITVDSDLADVLITQWTSDAPKNNCTVNAAGNKITITAAGVYWVTFHASVSLDSGATVKLSVEGYLDGVIQPNLHTSRTVSSTDVGSVSFGSFIDIASDVTPSDLDIRANIDSATARSLTVEDAQLNIQQVGGT